LFAEVPLEALIQDFRYAVRSLARQRAFTLASTLALALGVGASTALFSVLWTTLLQPLPYREPARLVAVLHGASVSGPVSPADYHDLKAWARSFSGMGAAQAWGANLGSGGRTERLRAMEVSAGLFDLLGVPTALGRSFAGDEEQPGRDHVAILSHGLWASRFGRDPAIVGREITLSGTPYVVVGVMPADFRFAPFWQTRPELWVPLALEARRADRGGRSLRVFARLRDGVSLGEARTELNLLTTRLAATYPDTDAGLTTGAVRLSDKAAAGVRATVLSLFGLALLVLLISCANMAALALSRTLGRGRELAVRAALGAARVRLIRLMAAEGLVIGALGAGGGVLVAWAGTTALGTLLPPDSLPPQAAVAVSFPALLFATAAAILSGVLMTTVSAWQVRDRALTAAVRDGGRSVTASSAGRHTRALLVGTEVAVSFVLIVAAGLLGRTVANLHDIDPGFRPDGVVALSISLDGTAHEKAADRVRFLDLTLSRIRALPGVAAAGAINHLPLAGDLWTLGYRIEGRPVPRPGEELAAAYRVITPGYFHAMGQPLLAGRDLSDADSAGGRPVVIVNETLASRHWPRRSALGERIVVPGPDDNEDPLTIVGIVADAHQRSLTTVPDDEVYLPLAERPSASPRSPMTLVARTAGNPAGLLGQLPTAVWAGDRAAAVYEGLTLEEVIDHEIWRQQLAARLAGVFAVVALVLAAIGIHGVVSYAASRRLREFGIRLALGATPAAMRRLALREALSPVLGGLAAGLVFALTASGILVSLLVGVTAQDPGMLGASAAVLLLASVWAGWLPARRAARLDAASVLRDE
jgi:putative ABC transport system permease protein